MRSTYGFLLLFQVISYAALHVLANSSPWITYPNDGFATMTHYTIPADFVAGCGCNGASTHFPTAAMSQMAFGSSSAYGPACGRCFNLTLLNTFKSTPPFFPNVTKSVVVKVTDKCPLGSVWCSMQQGEPNECVISFHINFSPFPVTWCRY